jgi:hypothetical protein
MIVNFRTFRINWDTRNVTGTFILIKKNKKNVSTSDDP